MAVEARWSEETRAALLRPALVLPPCGPDLDLEYDPLFLELFNVKLVPKEREKKIMPRGSGAAALDGRPEPIPWLEVERDCLALLERTRDARLFIVLIRCLTQREQGLGLCRGLDLLAAALELWPEELHPITRPEGVYDAQPRAAALSALRDQEGLLAEIRQIALVSQRGDSLKLGEVERSLSLPRPKDAEPPERARRHLELLRAEGHENLQRLNEALGLVRRLDADISRRLEGADFSLSPLISLLKVAAPPAGAPEAPEPPPQGAAPGPDAPARPAAKPPRGAAGRQPKTAASSPPATALAPVRASEIPDRLFAREQISEIRRWFEQHEPSSPVALLLAQAEGLVGKRFAELYAFLPREILEQWEKSVSGQYSQNPQN